MSKTRKFNGWILAGGLVVVLLVWKRREVVTVIQSGIRGIRNNNPGNIEKNGIAWQGLAPADQQTDPRFYVFSSPVYGIRALAKVLKTYRDQHGLTTIAGIISRWAPPVENNTGAYISAVAAAVGKSPAAPLDFATDLQPLVTAIIRHENGLQPYSAATIAEGVSLA